MRADDRSSDDSATDDGTQMRPEERDGFLAAVTDHPMLLLTSGMVRSVLEQTRLL